MSTASTQLDVVMKITGDKELLANLREISQQARMKIFRPAFRKGAQIVARDARRRAPKRTGFLKKAIKGISARRDASALVVMNKGIANASEMRAVKGSNERRPYRPAYIARIVEVGAHLKNGGTVAPQPFLNPALDAKKEAALNKIAAEIRKKF